MDDGTILKEGKKYTWSGFSDGLYTSYRWKDDKCKITKVAEDHVLIYDYAENKEHKYTQKGLKDMKISFKR